MRTEYNVEIIREPLSYQYIRWIGGIPTDKKPQLIISEDTKLVQDFRDQYLLLFTSEWNIRWALERNEGLELRDFSKN